MFSSEELLTESQVAGFFSRLVAKKLNTTKLSVAKLRDICPGLDIAVDVSIKRKQLYAEIEEYCQICRCRADK